MEVMINGKRYIPADKEADGISFWYMHDNHCFTKLYGETLDEILRVADEVERESPWGMLCPVNVLNGDIELRRIGKGVHSHGKETASWVNGKKAWREDVEKDADIMRLLPSNKE